MWNTFASMRMLKSETLQAYRVRWESSEDLEMALPPENILTGRFMLSLDQNRYGNLCARLRSLSYAGVAYPKTIDEAMAHIEHEPVTVAVAKPKEKVKTAAAMQVTATASKPSGKFPVQRKKLGQGPRQCLCCGSTEHLVAKCDEFQQIMAERNAAKAKPKTADIHTIVVSEFALSAWKEGDEALDSHDVILDNGATMHIFGEDSPHVERSYLGETVVLTGLGGCKYSQLRGTVPGFGEVILIPKAKFNIISLPSASNFSVRNIFDGITCRTRVHNGTGSHTSFSTIDCNSLRMDSTATSPYSSTAFITETFIINFPICLLALGRGRMPSRLPRRGTETGSSTTAAS